MHSGLEYYYKGQDWKEGIEKVTDDWDDAKLKRTMLAVVEHYLSIEKQEAVFAHWTPVEVEERITVRWGDVGEYTVYITGEPDMLMMDEFGDLHCVDHKFVNQVSNITAVPYKRQAYVYDWLITESTGRLLTSFIFSIINRVKVGEPIRSDVVVFNDELRAAFKTSLDGIVRDIVMLVDKNDHSVFYPNPSKDCHWKCPFYSVCPKIDSAPAEANEILVSNYEVTQDQSILRSPQITKGEN